MTATSDGPRAPDGGVPQRVAPDTQHWLVRPSTVRRLWIVGAVLLALTVAAEFVTGGKSWPGYAAVFGFLSCVVMVFAAKALGLVLKRPEEHYDDA